jgi:hypothetical protein
MSVASEFDFAPGLGPALRRWLLRLLYSLVILLAVIGAIATVLLITLGMSEVHSVADIEKHLDQFTAVLKEGFIPVWNTAKTLLELVSLVLLAVALFIGSIRLPMLARIVRDFITARGSIYALQSLITEAGKMLQNISNLEPTIQLLGEKIDAAQKQLGDLQRYTSSQRQVPEATPAAGPSGAPGQTAAEENGNWEKLRRLYYRNAGRIEGVINKISDGRTKLRYARKPRTNYANIINALANDQLITQAAKRASLQLNGTFKRYQSINTNIPDRVIGELDVLDAQLDHEIGSPPAEEDDSAGS